MSALPKSGGAKVFKGVSDRQIKNYFKQLTGSSKLPRKEPLIDRNGNINGYGYKVVDSKGNKFTLRDFSGSTLNDGTKPRWTIDIPNSAIGRGSKGTSEIKFK